MFNWFWEFLYMISKTIFRLIDGLVLCANKLCGIDPINFNGEETDFLSYLLFSKEVGFAFRVSAILATMLLVIFSVFMIIRSIAKDKAEGTPVQIAIKAFKTLLMFFLVPAVMLAFMIIGNAFVKALYAATVQAAAAPGAFLFSAFAEDGGMKSELAMMFRTGEWDYYDTALVSANMLLSNFPFIFSFIAGGVVLFGIGSSMLIFVDRVISLVILYIAAPISISTSVIDEGARFKLWRDQFLSKFIMGYGMILAINIYAIVCGLVMNPDFNFFPGDDLMVKFLDLLMKLLIIAGGALTMQKSMALIGNLVSQGAGSNELRDSVSAGALAKMAKGVAGGALGLASGVLFGNPLAKAGKSIVNDALNAKSRDLGNRLLNKLGMGVESGGGDDKSKSKSGADNNEKADYGSKKDAAKDAINGNDGGKFKTSDWGSKGNANNEQSKKGGNAVNTAIEGGNKDQQQQNNHADKQNDQPKEDNKQ